MAPAPAQSVPRCDCGKTKTERNGYWTCSHCDQSCHNACDPDDCPAPHDGCRDCIQYRSGTIKRINPLYHQ